MSVSVALSVALSAAPSPLPFFQVDAFAGQPFTGNPAAVVPLPHWLDPALLQAIAAENNLSETAFFVRAGSGYHIRWFTPQTEVDLCGHATLASAHVLFSHLGHSDATILFTCNSGALAVTRQEDGSLSLDLPRQEVSACPAPEGLVQALGIRPRGCYSGEDLLVELDSAAAVAALKPDFGALATLPWRGIIVTAAGADCDLVCRFFAPAVGINEDPVTGSAYTKLAPFWAERLGRAQLTARQLSPRGGHLSCQVKGNRVLLHGRALTVIRGELLL